MNRPIKALSITVAAAAALAAAGCGSGSGSSGGSSSKTLFVGVDLPFTGSSKDASDSSWNAMELYLKSHPKAGSYTIKLQKYDDATAAAGKWDPPQCTKNANDEVANTQLIAVMGTYNSGCAELEIPVLNQDPNGPLLEVSEANTYPGLTGPWDTGEPAKFYPTGVRNYARVVTTDKYQGAAGAQYAAQKLGIKKVLVLDDTEAYGTGVAKEFADTAKAAGLTVYTDAWDGKATSYTALFNKAKAEGVNAVYFGGIEDNNGIQLMKDKVSVLGDNTKVKIITPDGFVGYPDFDALPQAAGVYQTFPGLALDALETNGGATETFLKDYQSTYGGPPASPYALYGVQALQVIMAGIAKSDGTRKSVTAAVVGPNAGTGIDIPASEAILGKEIKIDPATGDVNAIDMTIQHITGGKEVEIAPWAVQPG